MISRKPSGCNFNILSFDFIDRTMAAVKKIFDEIIETDHKVITRFATLMNFLPSPNPSTYKPITLV